jgi:protein-S-isoprenylcysteine O-methyltransferase Ste14
LSSQILFIIDKIADGAAKNTYYLPALIIASLSALTILTSVALKFISYSKDARSTEKQTLVSTFSMIIVLLPIVPLVTNSIGVITVSKPLGAFFFIMGLLLIFHSAATNIIARITIGHFWSDHIVVHEQHTVIDKGVFAMVRHPMYSSLIFYNLGLAFIFMNYIILFINLVLFTPMMIYRAKQEESQILKVNKDYQAYVLKTPFLIPRPWRYRNK